MAEWVMRITNRNFDLDDYVPLDGQFTDPFYVHLRFRQYYHSEIYHDDREDTVQMSFWITGYNPTVNSPAYPCVCVYLGYPDQHQGQSCGVVVWGRGGTGDYTISEFEGTHKDINGTVTHLSDANWGSPFNGQFTTNAGVEFDYCNIPIIVMNANPDQYGDHLWYFNNPENSELSMNLYFPQNNPITNDILKTSVNWNNNEATADTQDWYIFNTFEDANIDMGIVTYTGQNPTGRFEIFKSNSEPVLYFIDEENSLELGLIASDIVGSVYSSINKQDVLDKQFKADEWTKKALQYDGPFYYKYQFMPDGDYTIGVTWDTNIYIAHNREQAEAYLRGEVPAEDLVNYGSVGKPEVAENETGTKELITEFGSNESMNVFSHDYIMNRSSLAAIGGKFFDTSILDALLEGLKIYGNNPMESVLSCIYFPFDLSSVCTASSVSSIYFGSYKMNNVSGVSKVGKRNGYKELGSTFIKPTFYNWLDYAVMHIYLYLPYIGFVELDINKYLNKWLKIIYMIDIHSGECEVSLLADGLLTDTYSGQIGIKQPLTYNDLSAYYQSQITALRNGVMTAIGLPVGGALTGAQIGSSGGPYGAAAGAAIGAGIGGTLSTPYAFYTGRNIGNTKPPLFSKGGYTSEIGANMPQYAFLVFMYNDVEIPENELLLYGKPSNKSGTVGSFSGFLSCSYVQLQCSGATEGEKNEILSYLQNGIYI